MSYLVIYNRREELTQRNSLFKSVQKAIKEYINNNPCKYIRGELNTSYTFEGNYCSYKNDSFVIQVEIEIENKPKIIHVVWKDQKCGTCDTIGDEDDYFDFVPTTEPNAFYMKDKWYLLS